MKSRQVALDGFDLGLGFVIFRLQTGQLNFSFVEPLLGNAQLLGEARLLGQISLAVVQQGPLALIQNSQIAAAPFPAVVQLCRLAVP